jgi:superfamily II DNA or RNA helicase
VKLRDYQEQAANASENEFFAGNRTQLIELPTGTGKTVVMGEIARRRLHLGRIIFTVHRQEIIRQTVAQLERATGITPGVVMASQDDYDSQIVCASIQTLARSERRSRLLSMPIATVFIDEVHHYTDKSTYAKVVEEVKALYPDALIVGVSATPYRMDKEDITEVFCPVFSRSMRRMQDENWLAETVWKPIYVSDMKLEGIRTRIQDGERDFSTGELAEEMMPHAREMARLSIDEIGSRSTVIFAVSIAHMQAMTDAYRELGLDIHPIWGDMPQWQRAETLDLWKRNQIQGVCNVGVLTEGFDNPGIECIVMARPTKSAGLYVQMLGRGLRLLETKPNCLVIEFTGTPNITETININITLSDIMGEMTDSPNGDGSPEYHVRLFKRWSAVALSSIQEFKVEIISTDAGVFGIAENLDNGLWDVIKIDDFNVSLISSRSATMRQAANNLTFALQRAGVTANLYRNQAKWRKEMPSERQVKYLSSIAPSRAELAQQEDWSKGKVSNEITIAKYRGIIRRWRKSQGWAKQDGKWVSS